MGKLSVKAREGSNAQAHTLELYRTPNSTGSFGGVSRLKRTAPKVSRKTLVKWLEKEPSYTLHKPVRYKFKRRKVIVGGIDDQYQLDLLDVSPYAKQNGGMRFLLTVIDVFSKYAWVRAIRNKTGESVKNAFDSILKEGRQPLAVQTDKGKEFTNNTFQTYLKAKGIKFFTSENDDIKASLVERLNGTLQVKIHRYFSANHTRQYLEVLQDIVDSYNSSFHKSIGMSPKEVNESNSETVWQRLYPPDWSKTHIPKLKVGDYVRISKTKRAFRKSYLPSWTTELFTVVSVKRSTPATYVIADFSGEVLKGAFYAQELQKVQPPEMYDIESIIKKRKRKGKTQYLVKWLNYPDSFNSWVEDIVSLV